MILKIILFILLAFLLIVTVICFLNIKVTVNNRNGLAYKITANGIRTKAKYLLGIDLDDDGKDKPQSKKTKSDGNEKDEKKKNPRKSARNKKAVQEKTEPDIATSTVISLLVNIAKTGIEQLPKCLRIRLKYLNIRVGGTDAAQTALNYGKIYGIVSGALAFLGDYKGIFHGFRTKRNRICITADFFGEETSAEFEFSVSFFLWQLFYYNLKLEISAIMAIMEDESEPAEVAARQNPSSKATDGVADKNGGTWKADGENDRK